MVIKAEKQRLARLEAKKLNHYKRRSMALSSTINFSQESTSPSDSIGKKIGIKSEKSRNLVGNERASYDSNFSLKMG